MESYNPEAELTAIDEIYQKQIDALQIETQEDVDKAFVTFDDLFYKDESLYCKRLLDKLESSQNETQYIIKKIQNSAEAQLIKADFKIVEKSVKFVKLVQSGSYGDEWYKFIDREDTKILYRREGESSLYTFYLEKLVNAPLFNLVSVLAEAQTFKDWVPLFYKSEISNEVSQFRKVVEYAIKFPWPFSNRSVYCGAGAVPIEDDEAICLALKTTKTWLKGMTIKKDESNTEVDIHFLAAYIKTISEEKQRISLIINMDPKIDAVPQWLINQFMKVLMVVFLNQIASRAEKLPEQNQDLIKEKKAFYQQVKDMLQRLNQFREMQAKQSET